MQSLNLPTCPSSAGLHLSGCIPSSAGMSSTQLTTTQRNDRLPQIHRHQHRPDNRRILRRTPAGTKDEELENAADRRAFRHAICHLHHACDHRHPKHTSTEHRVRPRLHRRLFRRQDHGGAGSAHHEAAKKHTTKPIT